VEKLLFNRLYPNAKMGWANRIRQVSFRITDRCNLRCHTCGQWGDSGFLHGKELKELIGNEVTPERYAELLKDLVKHNHRPLVYIWGGEPMLYPGILNIIETATRLGLPTSIATNGTNIASVAERLVRISMFLIQISIDGHNANLHNRLRPASGKLDNFAGIEAGLEAIKRARRDQNRSLPMIASLTVISKENANHLVDIYEAFKDRVDMFVFYLSWWITPERAKSHDRNFAQRFGFTPKMHRGWLGNWQPDNYKALNSQLQGLLSRSRPLSATPVTIIPPITGTENLHTYYVDHAACFGFEQCISIYQTVEVDSNGDMTPCRDYRDYTVGNIKEHTISELWNSKAYCNFRQSLATKGLMPICSRCCGLMGY
jgi:radical SAM protein with 4Fe4S-binding SPASM domain